jgi:hypothetical protein
MTKHCSEVSFFEMPENGKTTIRFNDKIGNGKGKIAPVLNSAPRHNDEPGDWSASSPDRFTPDIHWTGGLVDPTAGLDAVE